MKKAQDLLIKENAKSKANIEKMEEIVKDRSVERPIEFAPNFNESQSVGVQVTEKQENSKTEKTFSIGNLIGHKKAAKKDSEFIPELESEKKAKKSGKTQNKGQLLEPNKDCTDRHQILKCLRTGKKFGAFTDEQLLYMTDPDVLAKLEGKTQPQKIQEFMKSSIFYGFKGKLAQPTLCTIFQQFKIGQGKNVKNLKIVDKN